MRNYDQFITDIDNTIDTCRVSANLLRSVRDATNCEFRTNLPSFDSYNIGKLECVLSELQHHINLMQSYLTQQHEEE